MERKPEQANKRILKMPKKLKPNNIKNPTTGENSSETHVVITRILQNFTQESARIFVSVYATEAAFNLGALPIDVREFNARDLPAIAEVNHPATAQDVIDGNAAQEGDIVIDSPAVPADLEYTLNWSDEVLGRGGRSSADAGFDFVKRQPGFEGVEAI